MAKQTEQSPAAREHVASWRRQAGELERKARLLRFSGDQAGAEELEATAADYRADAGWLELELAMIDDADEPRPAA